MKVTTAVEADSSLTESKYYTDWPKGGAIATKKKRVWFKTCKT